MQTNSSLLSFKNLFGLDFVSATLDDFGQAISNLVIERRRITIFPVSVDVLIKSKKDVEFSTILKRASFLTPDGMPITWAASLKGNKLKSKISGSDFFPLLCKIAARKNYKVFFLGARPGVAQQAHAVLQRRFPKLNAVGIYSPPFGFERIDKENQKIIGMIKEKKPDILFVGFGAPKQEKWIWKFKNDINVPILVAVGASFDFVAGKIKRAPKWMQKLGLEWFHRLCQEPRRLWKRYLIGNSIFAWMVIKELIK